MLKHATWSGPGRTLQLAADGAWEECVSIELPSSTFPSAAVELMERARAHVGIELFIGGAAPDGAFVGCRLPVAHARHRLARLSDLARSTFHYADIGEALRALLAHLSQPAPEPFTIAELGVVNAWRSAGPRMIWQNPEPLPDAVRIAGLLRTWPVYGRTQSRPLALELTVESRRCWIGVPVAAG